jgi:hypothetical protein
MIYHCFYGFNRWNDESAFDYLINVLLQIPTNTGYIFIGTYYLPVGGSRNFYPLTALLAKGNWNIRI